ncbi:MAG: AMP-binding protein, partial [bacterium]|nr:AMP-binding protein [bacterium]
MNSFKKAESKNIEDIIALTPMQEGMLVHYLKEPGSGHYFEQLSLTMRGPIDFKCFKQAWNTVVKTNAMLRTRFKWKKVKIPVQIILKNHSVPVVFHDLSTGDINDKCQSLKEIKDQDRIGGFDLNSVPFRITLCKIEEQQYEMIISNHHVLYDGWSNRIILEDFFSAYHRLARGESPPKPYRQQYKEFVNQIRRLDTGKQQNYWRNYLKGFDEKPELSIKRKRSKKENRTGSGNGYCKTRFSTVEREDLELFTRSHKVTLSGLIYSAWGLLLQRYNNQPDIIFGTTVSGRSLDIKGIEDIVGLFINTIPLRVRSSTSTGITGNRREIVEDFLTRLTKELRERESCEHTSLVEIKDYGKVEFEGELFDTIVVVENYPLDKVLFEKSDNSASSLSVDSFSMVEMTHYDLTVAVTLLDDIEVKFTYNKDLLDETLIKNLAAHFKKIVRDIIANPGKELAALEILPEEEKKKIIYDFNNTVEDYPKEKTLHGLFEEQVEQTPNRTALTGESLKNVEPAYRYSTHHLTYGCLNNQANQLAHRLKEEGVQTESIVAIMVNRSVEMIIGILGILKAGGAYLP